MTRALQILNDKLSVDLFDLTQFKLLSFSPESVDYKDGGVFSEDKQANDRQIIQKALNTVTETVVFAAFGPDQDTLAASMSKLFRLREYASDYGIPGSHAQSPVYIINQAGSETGARYARVVKMVFSGYPEMFDSTLDIGLSVEGEIKASGMPELTVAIERTQWSSNPPREATCVVVNTQRTLPIETWQLASGTPSNNLNRIIDTAGAWLVGTGTLIWRSSNGTTWGNPAVGPGVTTNGIIEFNSRLYAGSSSGIYRSGVNDNGNNWSLASASVKNGQLGFGFAALNGFLYAVTNDPASSSGEGIYRSPDGLAWTQVFDMTSLPVPVVIAAYNNKLYVIDIDSHLYTSVDGITWTLVMIMPALPYSSTANYNFLKVLSNGLLYTGGGSGVLVKDVDSDLIWTLSAALPNTSLGGAPHDLELSASSGLFYATGVPASGCGIWYSPDGLAWIQDSGENTAHKGISRHTSAGGIRIYVSNNNTNIYVEPRVVGFGPEPSCDNEHFVSNFQGTNKLTHIYRFDASGPTYTNILDNSLPAELLPTTVAIGDIVYFGADAPFNSVVFSLVEHGLNIGHTAVWEYFAVGWNTLPASDKTGWPLGTGVPLSRVGVASIHFPPTTGWGTTSVNGVTKYWIRLRVTAASGVTPQVDQYPYTVANAYVDMAESEVKGDLEALARIKVFNRSGGGGVQLHAKRVLIGLRDYERGPQFTPYLNASDTQNPAGVTLTLGAGATLDIDPQAPAGKRVTYNPAGGLPLQERLSWNLDTHIAKQYYGIFRAFLRCQRTAATEADITLQLQHKVGSGGLIVSSPTRQIRGSNVIDVVDFGKISLPAGDLLLDDEVGDTTKVSVLASFTSGTPDLYIYDLILMPCDEMLLDLRDTVNDAFSGLDFILGSYETLLDVDSIRNPRRRVRALVKKNLTSNEFVTSTWLAVPAQEAILKNNARQRLWFFCIRTSAVGASYTLVSEPAAVHSIQVFKSERYQLLRGNS